MHSDAEMVGRRLLERAGIEPGGGRPWDPVIHDPRFWARVLRHRELGLGESYQDGWWDVPALDELMVRLLRADLQGQIRTSPKLGLLLARSLLWNRQSVRGASRNARSHYNTGNDLFARMLDARMVYSCAYWDGQTDLEAAQEAKLELICRKLHLQPGMTMLDIGCGWGGLAVHAARHHGVHVTGISPAAEQLKVATERGAGLPVASCSRTTAVTRGVTTAWCRWGCSHVGPRNHRDFFRTCDRLLTPDGLMLHHTIHGLRPRRHADPGSTSTSSPAGCCPPPHRSLARWSRTGWWRTSTSSVPTTTAR
ncbi:MAG: class I SAM-dependent methyltransferase [Thermoleophilia bacterium]